MFSEVSLEKAILNLLTTTRLSHADIAERCRCFESRVRKVWLENGRDDIRPTVAPITLAPIHRVKIDHHQVKRVVEAYFNWPNDLPDELATRLNIESNIVIEVCRKERLPFRGLLYPEDRR